MTRRDKTHNDAARRRDGLGVQSKMSHHHPKLFDFMQEREAIMQEVVGRVLRVHTRSARVSRDRHLDFVLNEAAFLEMQRLEKGRSRQDLHGFEFWHGLARSLGKASEQQKIEQLRALVQAYCEDVAGKFTPAVYKFATSVLPMALGFAFNAHSFDSMFKNFKSLSERVIVQGHLETLRRLSEVGTLVVVPTHSSNLDSIVVGWGLEASGLPPVTYGAGKNLFSHPLLSFFMQNLGAYRVDRRLRHTLYKDVLKAYSEVLLERGYHSLFFPGAGRCRSNVVEQHLKLGLMGTALTAYTNNMMAARPKPKIFICPMTINYHLVLEAETLIAEHLRQDGGARFIIDDDEFSDVKKVAKFMLKTMSMEYTLHMQFAPPLDPFGNPVDASGDSLDPHGRPIDTARYLWVNGRVQADAKRDAEYTRECGRAVAQAFKRNTVAVSTSFLSFALFQVLQELYAGMDLYRLLQVTRGELLPFEVIYQRAERLRAALKAKAHAGGILLARDVEQLEIPVLVERAAKIFGMYHPVPVVQRRANGLEVSHPNLLHFYSNRLAGYGLEDAQEMTR
jgi:glycerol-3-phosphate O-acyltransferase